MVYIHVLNPLHRLRRLTKCWTRGWKAALPETTTLSTPEVECAPTDPVQEPIYDIRLSGSKPHYDREYYANNEEGSFCVFLVEDTLFRVHRCYLVREPSVFADMLTLPQSTERRAEGNQDATIHLFDAADQFRDLLWALYAPPCRLTLFGGGATDDIALGRLLNIAELAIKYCLASYEEWAMTKIYHHLTHSGGSSFLRTACASFCSRILNVAVLSVHEPLWSLVEERLVSRILWSGDREIDDVLKVATYHGLPRLRGAIHYRFLLDYLKGEKATETLSGENASSRPDFSLIENARQRETLESAFDSLSQATNLSSVVPPLEDRLCPQHDECTRVWTRVWEDAHREALRLGGPGFHSKVDLLGRLKMMVSYLRKALPGEGQMSITCTMTALETVAEAREDVINSLIGHFELGQA